MPDISYYEKSVAEESADETMEVLERTTSIGYVHNKIGPFQSEEIDFRGTEKQQRAQRNDKG